MAGDRSGRRRRSTSWRRPATIRPRRPGRLAGERPAGGRAGRPGRRGDPAGGGAAGRPRTTPPPSASLEQALADPDAGRGADRGAGPGGRPTLARGDAGGRLRRSARWPGSTPRRPGGRPPGTRWRGCRSRPADAGRRAGGGDRGGAGRAGATPSCGASCAAWPTWPATPRRRPGRWTRRPRRWAARSGPRCSGSWATGASGASRRATARPPPGSGCWSDRCPRTRARWRRCAASTGPPSGGRGWWTSARSSPSAPPRRRPGRIRSARSPRWPSPGSATCRAPSRRGGRWRRWPPRTATWRRPSIGC